MRVLIDRKDLVEALGLVHAAAPRTGTIPILQNVLLQADASLSLVCTNIDVQLAAEAPARVEAKGGVSTPAGVLYDLARALPAGGEILLDDAATAGRLTVQCGGASYKLPTLPTADFPVMTADATASLDMPAAALRRLLGLALPSASTEETRYYLCAVHLRPIPGDGGLRAEATSGMRAAMIDEPEVRPGALDASLSAASVGMMLKLLDAASGEARLRLGAERIAVSAGAAELVARLLQGGSYPDLDRVWPQEAPREVTADLPLFAATLKRAALLADDKATLVRMSFEPGRVRMRSRSEAFAEGEESLAVTYDGAPFELGFNSRNMLALLGQVDGETVTFRLNGERDPVTFRGEKDPRAHFLVMPCWLGA